MSKKKSQIKASLKKATIELLLLKLLDEGDRYGYQLAQELKRRRNKWFVISGCILVTQMNQIHGRNEHEKIFIRTSDTHVIAYSRTDDGICLCKRMGKRK